MNPILPDFGSTQHLPVLYQSVLHWLQPSSGSKYLDGTLGGGGHAEGILESGASLLGLDRDADALALAQERLSRFGERAILRHSSYRRAKEILGEIGWGLLDGVLLDLGLSSLQLADPQRGFAFRLDGPLDMRFDRSSGETAADLLNTLPVEEIARILDRYGEEPQARRIAQAVVRSRPLSTTRELAELVAGAAGRRTGSRRPDIHPATRAFQALRIAVNHELEELEAALPELIESLAPGGRLVVISFHSLEDRMIKRAIREASGRPWRREPKHSPFTAPPAAILRELTPKPILPDPEELAQNPKARSAKMRVAEKIQTAETPTNSRKAGSPAIRSE